MKLNYPDLGEPPRHWSAGQTGASVRLVPPGAYLDRSRCFIVVSPLVPLTAALPALPDLLQQTLAAECAATGARVVSPPDPSAYQTSSGLAGIRAEVTLERDGHRQQRCYVMLTDAHWLYGLHYAADEGTWSIFLETFDRSAASILPFDPPTG